MVIFPMGLGVFVANLILAAVHEKLFFSHKTVMGKGARISLYLPRDPFAETVKDFVVLVVDATSHKYEGSGP